MRCSCRMIRHCGSFLSASTSHSRRASGFSSRSRPDIRMDTEEFRISDFEFRISELAWLPFLLQTTDALFPTGAYAHSLGFEEIVRLGRVRDEESLREFLRTQLIPALRELE